MKALGIVVLLAAIGGGWLGYTRWFGGAKVDEFVLREVSRGTIIKTVAATGTLEPLVKVIVGSQVSGNILHWYTDFNASVTKDMVLAELDPDRFKRVRDQAKADLALARAGEQEARVKHKDLLRERDRIANLRQDHNASENELLVAAAAADGAEAAWHGAEARVQSAEAFLGSAEVDLSRTIIKSPIDGVVISRDIDVGQTVAASLQAPTLFTIANDLKRMQVSANVSEADIGLIAEGLHASFTVDAYPLRTFEGTISQIRYNATVLDSVVTYVTMIQVNNDDLALRPGMTANVTFEVAKAENALRIPNAALRFDPTPPEPGAPPKPRKNTGPTVYRLANGRPEAVAIRIGLSDPAFSELVDGDLREGDRIITDRNWSASSTRPDMTQSMRSGGGGGMRRM